MTTVRLELVYRKVQRITLLPRRNMHQSAHLTKKGSYCISRGSWNVDWSCWQSPKMKSSIQDCMSVRIVDRRLFVFASFRYNQLHNVCCICPSIFISLKWVLYIIPAHLCLVHVNHCNVCLNNPRYPSALFVHQSTTTKPSHQMMSYFRDPPLWYKWSLHSTLRSKVFIPLGEQVVIQPNYKCYWNQAQLRSRTKDWVEVHTESIHYKEVLRI